MNEDLSTQFPSPPEVHPTSSSWSRLWQAVSLLMIISGAVLIFWGGWQLMHEVIALNNPPARILKVSPQDLEPISKATAVPSPTPGPAQPTQPVEVAAVALKAKNTPAPTAMAVPTDGAGAPSPTTEPDQVSLEPTPSPTAEPTQTPPEPTQLPTIETAPESEGAALSLADNPLPVVEEDPAAPPVEGTQLQQADVPGNPDAVPAYAPLSRIVAETIELDSSIVEVGWQTIMHNGSPVNVWSVADFAVGWHSNSALPGQGGNVVLSGHHNINGEVFRYTVDLQPGDVVTLYDANQTVYTYVVEDKFIIKDKDEPDPVRLDNAKWIGPFNEERLTLITCWPYTNNTHRVIVIGKPVSQQ